jgi:hypothetical protein
MEWRNVVDIPTVEPDATSSAVPYFGIDGRLKNEARRGEHTPQAWQASLSPSYGKLRVHFHPVNQFQLFTHGGGKFGRHAVHAGSSVHYADAFTPYGPIVPDEIDGVSFITMRSVHDMGAFYMPESQADLRLHSANGLPRRSLEFEFSEYSAAEDTWSDLVREDDGLRMAVADVDARGIELPSVKGDGAFLVLLSGQITVADESWNSRAIAWCDSGDVGRGLRLSSPLGISRVALLQLPAVLMDRV